MSSIEKVLTDLTDAIKENTAVMLKVVGGAPAAEGKTETGKPRTRRSQEDPAPAATEDRASSRRSSKENDKKDESITLDDLKRVANKFLDVDDAEYNLRVEKVFDPYFDKYDCKMLADLPKSCWADLADDIASYGTKPSRRSL